MARPAISGPLFLLFSLSPVWLKLATSSVAGILSDLLSRAGSLKPVDTLVAVRSTYTRIHGKAGPLHGQLSH